MRTKIKHNAKKGKYPILMVEDDANDIFLIKRAFRKAEIANPIHVVKNGEEAIAYLAGREKYCARDQFPLPSLVLLDLKLPRKSGHEVMAWMRCQPGLKRIPIVVLTSSKHSADINRAYDLGINSYLIKPESFNDLLGMICNINTFWLLLNENPDINVKEKRR